MSNLKKLLLALIVMLTLSAVETRGESFVITDVQGGLYVSTSLDGGPPTLRLGPTFSLSGPGLSIFTQSHPSGDPGHVEARDLCLVEPWCTPGRMIGTKSSFSGLIASQFFASARVNGVLYYMVRVTGSMNFVSPSIVLPSSPAPVTVPFTFYAELTGDAFQPGVVNPVFKATLSGRGQAVFHFTILGFDFLNPRYRLDFVEYRFEPFPIMIDIRPGTFPNNINPKSKGKIPVAIMTTPSFNAATVDPTTLLFGSTGNEVAPAHSVMEDVDGDGDLDLVLHFATQNTGIACGNTTASLTGALLSGEKFKGFDFIETVGCN